MKLKLLHLGVTIVTLFSFSLVNFAQTPNLGTAATFVLFSSNGAVTNTGITRLTGNVGTNSGASTGFGNVNGVMHTSDGATASAAADLLTAYNQLNSAIPTASHAPLLGNGETLNAGVYFIAGTSSLDHTLILDGQNNANALFIFQISGAFSTTASSAVSLINGAKACNVFWKVEGMVSMATATNMKGNVIANNAAIDMSSGVQLEGRALSTTGAVTLNALTGKTPIGCGSPVLTGPAAPNLASATCYAIFSGNGEVTNSGITNVTGDIGTNVGLTTGYNPLLVNGMIHTIPDGSTAACASDLLNAYSYLNTVAPDIELLYPAQFGSGLTLTPHTYIMNGATSFTDTVFLNAEGNPNAVFIIKINGALSTSTYATVTLMNGAKFENVFWKVEGAVNINNYSDFKGTIVCNNGAISLSTGTILNGRALTTTGALGSNAINATMPAGCSSLPLSLLSFSAAMQNNDGNLAWKITNEKNTSVFEVERSIDGMNYQRIGSLPADASLSSVKSYSFSDRNVVLQSSSVVFYRLKMKDVDNKFTYSNIISLRLNSKAHVLLLYPNPVKESAVLSIHTTKKEEVTYNIVDYSGRVVYVKSVTLNPGANTFNINVSKLAVGVYSLTLQGEQAKQHIRFIKQ